MSRSAAAKKRRNQAKNLKRKNACKQVKISVSPLYSTVGKVYDCDVFGSDIPCQIVEFWDSGWYLVTTDRRMQREKGKRTLPVCLDPNCLDTYALAANLAPAKGAPEDVSFVPVWVCEYVNGNWHYRQSICPISWV